MSTGNGAGGAAGSGTDAPGPEGEPPRDPVAGKSVSEVFGEIVWLMTQDKLLKALPLAELEWLVMPPILLRQFRIFYAPPKETDAAEPGAAPAGAPPPTQPIGAVLFAMASEAVAAALAADAGAKLRLTPQDWRSGPQRRVVRVIAPFGGAEEMLAEMQPGAGRPGRPESG